MCVQKSNLKISAHPDLATNLLQILIPTTFNSLLCQKANLHFSSVLKNGLLGKYLIITPKKSKLKIEKKYMKKIFVEIFACPKSRFSGTSCPKDRQDVLAKSLLY